MSGFSYDYTDDELDSSNQPPYRPVSEAEKQRRAKRQMDAFNEERERMTRYAVEIGEGPRYDPWTGSYF